VVVVLTVAHRSGVRRRSRTRRAARTRVLLTVVTRINPSGRDEMCCVANVMGPHLEALV
jgi:hypothetical protein